MFQVYPGRFHDFFEDSRSACLLYVALHILFHVCYVGGLLTYIATSRVRPLEVVESFTDVREFAEDHGFYAVKRSAGAEAICWAVGAILILFVRVSTRDPLNPTGCIVLISS